MVPAIDTNSGVYELLLVQHRSAVVVGIGGVTLDAQSGDLVARMGSRPA
jgi:hypothetical protein